MVSTFTTNLPIPAKYLKQMRDTQQNPCFHAEGDVLTHTLMVLQNVIELDDSWNLTEEERLVLYWAAILHDIGKPSVTKWEAGRFHSHGHEEAGIPIARSILLQRSDISAIQRRQILALVRWHSIPLHYGLRKKPIDAYKKIALELDIRMLGIFAYCDLTGRICKNQTEVIQLITHFNQEIVPEVLNTFGPYSHVQKIYEEASLPDKNRLWEALAYPDSRLLEQLLQTTASKEVGDTQPYCIIPVGVSSPQLNQYIDQKFGDVLRIRIDKQDKSHLHNAIFTQAHIRENMLFEGDFTELNLRNELVKVLRHRGKEVRFLFFETGLVSLLQSVQDPVLYAELRKSYDRLRIPHPWEAHRTDFIHLA